MSEDQRVKVWAPQTTRDLLAFLTVQNESKSHHISSVEQMRNPNCESIGIGLLLLYFKFQKEKITPQQKLISTVASFPGQSKVPQIHCIEFLFKLY